MNWTPLQSVDQLNEIQEESKKHPVLIFKHSTRCSTSMMTLNRLERSWTDEKSVTLYFLDLISFREVSNQVAASYGVAHESPQVLIIKDGKVVFHDSHFGIEASAIKNALK